MIPSARAWERLVAARIVVEDTGIYGRRLADAWTVAVGVLALVGCAFVVRDGTVGSLEESVFHAVNGLPGFLEAPMWVLQLFGLLVTPLLLAVVALGLGRARLGAALVAAVPLKLLLEREVVKQIVQRQRPGTTIPDAILRDVAVAGLAFPSGHAVFAFAIAGLAGPYLNRPGRIVVYTLAVLNGVARIYLGAHSPLDIVGGAGLGLAIAGGLNLVAGVPVGSPQR